MSPEAQRIAIAEACGILGPYDDRWIKEYEKEGLDAYGFTGFENGKLVFVRDYLNDLNAAHEAERVLTEKQGRTYAFILAQVLDTAPTVDLDDQFLNIHATAAQRAEAFLRTIGKWEASK